MSFDWLSAWRRRWLLATFLAAATASGAGIGPASAQFGPESVALLDRLCAQTLRSNEEDRLYGMISLTVRATIRYRGAAFQSNVIDWAVQDALDAMIDDCPELTAADRAKRLDMAIAMISDATTKVLGDAAAAGKSDNKDSPFFKRRFHKSTAADLSEELSTQEIDQWLDSLPPRERALSLFLYASDVTPKEIAEAVGEPVGALQHQFGVSKTDLMRIFSEGWQEPVAGPHAAPAMKFTESGEGFATLMKAAETPSGAPSAAAGSSLGAGAPPLPEKAVTDGALSSLKVTGISDDLYAGWSLLAVAHDLPRGQRVAVTQPFLLEPDNPHTKRMLVTDIAEIGNPNAGTRRFLLKAYAIDADKDAAGLKESFHAGPPLANDEAKKTLANPDLTSIEIARCLWHDFGTGPDPGLCRAPAASP